MASVKLSNKGAGQQKALIDNFRDQMIEIANNAIVEMSKISSFEIMSDEYSNFKGQIIDELTGNYEDLKFFTKWELQDVLLSIIGRHKDLIQKSIIDNYEKTIKDLRKALELYHPF